MDGRHDDELQALHAGLARHLDERTAALLMKQVVKMEGRDWATSDELSDLAAAIMARFEQVDARFEQVDGRFERLETRFEEWVDGVDGRFERLETRFEEWVDGVDGRFERLETRFDERIGQLHDRHSEWVDRIDERIDARHEADDARYELLAARIDNVSDRIHSDLRGELLAAVTTQTRTLLLALLGSFAVYAALTVTLVA